MLSSTLLVLLPLIPGLQDPVRVQAGHARNPSITSQLPDELTLGCLELAPPAELLEHGSRIWQLRVLQDEKVQGFLRWIAASEEPSFGRFLERSEKIGQVFAGMDRGLALAWIFPSSERTEPQLAFLGSSSDMNWLREQPGRLRALLEPKGERPAGDEREFSARSVVLGSSPVMADVFRLQGQVKEQWWERYRNDAVMVARRGRLLGFVLNRDFDDQNRTEPRALQALASVLGLAGHERGGNALSVGPRPESEGTVLGRLVFRWRKIIESENRVPERARKEMASVGLDRFEGFRSELRVENDRLVEDFELHHTKAPNAEAPVSPFELLLPSDGGLFRAAERLPEDTVAAVRARLAASDCARFTNALLDFERANDEERKLVFHWGRMLLGLSPADSRPGTELGWPEELGITIFVLPPEMGLTPELFVAFDVGDRQIDLRAILGRIARDLGGISGIAAEEIEAKIKTYGRGDEAVPYLALSDLLTGGGDTMDTIAMRMLGGRYLSVARVGEQLVYGMHPRALKRMRSRVEQGRTLAARDDFRAHFAGPSQNPLEFFLDAEGLAEAAKPSMQFVNGPLFMAFFGLRVALAGAGGVQPEPVKMVIPDVMKLIRAATDESIVVEATEYGHSLRVRGCGLLSPSVWIVTGFAIDAITSFSPMLPH